jgi:hypothetical protein
VILVDGEPTYEIIPDRAFDHIGFDRPQEPPGNCSTTAPWPCAGRCPPATLEETQGAGHGNVFSM